MVESELPLPASSDPQQSIFEKLVLLWVGEDFVAVAHVHVDHAVLDIRPDYGDVSSGQCVLEAQRIVGWIEGDEDFHIFVGARAGLPDVPLVRGRGEMRG
jgi:hypothetical protein